VDTRRKMEAEGSTEQQIEQKVDRLKGVAVTLTMAIVETGTEVIVTEMMVQGMGTDEIMTRDGGAMANLRDDK
jgi:hypothetical protein